jgi:hypothetical protein
MCERTPDISEACQFVNGTRKSTKLRFIIRHRTIEILIPYFYFYFSYFEVEITKKNILTLLHLESISCSKLRKLILCFQFKMSLSPSSSKSKL